MSRPSTSHYSAGFTLVEFGIVVPILIATALVLFNAIFAIIESSTVERMQITLAYDKQTAMNNIEEDTVLTSMFLPVIDTNVSDPHPPTSNGGVWSYKGETANIRALLLREYSTTTNPLSLNRQPAFIDDDDPAGAACTSANIYFNDPQQYNTIYFVNNGTLYRKRLIDTATPLCNPGQYQKLSCPAITPRNGACQADDEVIAQNVTKFAVKYYGDKTSASELDVYATGADPELVSTAVDAEITLDITRTASGKSITSSSTLRFSKLNTKPKSL